ncbi:MAG: hypothetical protein HY269_05055 [Deltaproteobacteria bacterium]|nr:hypothetical protein [Deltaproteobacteria bacterium]
MRKTAVPAPRAVAGIVAGILETYAERGVFRGFSRTAGTGGRVAFHMTWHRDRLFELVLDERAGTLKFPALLPSVPARSAMYRELREFVEARFAAELPEHRRVDAARARVVWANRAGDVALTWSVLDGDFAYATRKLIHLVHEIYMVFLADGRYYPYLIEVFDLDPDRM